MQRFLTQKWQDRGRGQTQFSKRLVFNMTLRIRITLLTLGLLALSLLLIGASVYATFNLILYNNIRTDLRTATAQAINQLARGGSFEGFAPGIFVQADLLVDPQATPEQMADAVLTVQRNFPPDVRLDPLFVGLRLSPTAYHEMLRSGGVIKRIGVPRERGPEIPLLAQAVYQPDGSAFQYNTPLIITVAKSTEEITSTLQQFAQTYTATALLVLMLGGYLAFRVVRSTLEPLEWVAKKAEQVSNKPERLPEIGGDNEVSSLVKSLNRMLSRLDNAWETQSRFLADASHELRTPVTAILGHVSYLVRRTQMSEQQRESLEIIKRESERMQKLVGDLLELSKSGGSWKVDLGPVHIATVLHEICEEYHKSFEGSIEVKAPENLWVLGDPERLHQVIANLVSNAIKAGSSQVRLVAIDLTERAVIRIEDNGEGIAREHLPHLFERFYRIDKARDRERGGSGLGLAIVRTIVEAHGGTVWAESELGKGSVFNVSLRHSPAPQQELA